jgi:hypothetical protein
MVCARYGPTREGEHQEKDPVDKDADLVQVPGKSNVGETSEHESAAVEGRTNVGNPNDYADDRQNEWRDRYQDPKG